MIWRRFGLEMAGAGLKLGVWFYFWFDDWRAVDTDKIMRELIIINSIRVV